MVRVVELEYVEPGKDGVLFGPVELEITDERRVVRAPEERENST